MNQAWDIWSEATERGDAVRLSEITGKSAEIFNSYGRRPPSDDYPNGTGRESPITHYKQLILWLIAANRRSAIKLHRLVDDEIRDLFDDTSHSPALIEEVKRVYGLIRGFDRQNLRDASDNELILLNSLLGELEDESREARARIRAERRLRQTDIRQVG